MLGKAGACWALCWCQARAACGLFSSSALGEKRCEHLTRDWSGKASREDGPPEAVTGAGPRAGLEELLFAKAGSVRQASSEGQPEAAHPGSQARGAAGWVRSEDLVRAGESCLGAVALGGRAEWPHWSLRPLAPGVRKGKPSSRG